MIPKNYIYKVSLLLLVLTIMTAQASILHPTDIHVRLIMLIPMIFIIPILFEYMDK